MQRGYLTARRLILTRTVEQQKCQRLISCRFPQRTCVRQLSSTPLRQNRIHDVPPLKTSPATKSRTTLYAALAIASLTAAVGAYTITPSNKPTIFATPRFTPFKLIAKEPISSTSFILTVRPQPFITSPPPTDPYISQWTAGTWSVEFKQPQLQIARSYTPLPPSTHPDPNIQNGDLRFLVRKEKGGEMSNYLAALPVGQMVELRGPHEGLSLDGVREVLFLAGGTGIAPALQVVYALLRGEDRKLEDMPRIRIVWANRRREDCIGGGKDGDIKAAGAIVKELQAMSAKYPDVLRVEYLVDQEGSVLDRKKLLAVTKNESEVKFGNVHMRIDKKLLIVSGPEGFVNHFAGPKKWEDGKEGQGELGGLIGRLGLRDWKVWKL